jgi:hypothetical protein
LFALIAKKHDFDKAEDFLELVLLRRMQRLRRTFVDERVVGPLRNRAACLVGCAEQDLPQLGTY